MNHLIEQHSITDVMCDSAGTSSYHVGSSPDRRMRAAARQRGIELVGQSRQFIHQDFERFDWILAMDHSNYRDILSLDLADQYQHKVKLMCDFCTQHTEKEVPDPYYGGPEGFNYVIDLLFDACDGLLASVQ